MSDPLSLLPLALAAGGGRVDDHDAAQLVAAGLTLLQRSAPLVRALAGRRTAILLPTSHRFVVALAASEGHGAVLINPLAAAPEIAHQLRDANVGAVFTIAALAPRVPDDTLTVLLDDAPRAATVVLPGGETRTVDLGSHFGLELEGESDVPGSDEECAIVYTSAMAGTPLGAVLTHRNLLANGRATVEAGANVADDHVLALLPFSHLFGLTVTLTAPLLAGARVTTMERFNPVKAAELLVNGDITEVVGVPTVFYGLLAALERRGEKPRALRLCICGGAELPVTLQARWAEVTGVELRQGYGLTEGGPVCLFNRVDRPNVRGSLGVAFPGVEVAVREPVPYDDAGIAQPGGLTPEVAAGETGEICVRGSNVFARYLGVDMRAPSRPGLPLRDGWLYTGDLGRRQADDTIAFAGLVKPMFTRSGFNVYPKEIARALGELPGVAGVEVSPIPEPVREHDIAVAVHAPGGKLDEAEVKRWCEARLAGYKQPSEVRVED